MLDGVGLMTYIVMVKHCKGLSWDKGKEVRKSTETVRGKGGKVT